MNVIRQTARGCRDLPHVGKHPGTTTLLILLALGAAAGYKGGLAGMLFGAGLMAIFMVPLYLVSAHHRAGLSDFLDH